MCTGCLFFTVYFYFNVADIESFKSLNKPFRSYQRLLLKDLLV